MATVIVGCKLPSGLTLEIVEPGKDDAGKIGTMPRPAGKRIHLNGANSLRREASALGVPMLAEYPFGITRVDEDFWKQWLARHQDFDFVKNGMIFAVQDEKAAKSEARDRFHDVKTGLEPKKPADADPASLAKIKAQEQEIPALVTQAA